MSKLPNTTGEPANAPDPALYKILRPRVLPLDEVLTSDLPRDRLDLEGQGASEAMQALKASLQTRGQRSPVVVYRDGEFRYQLVSGWRRLTSLRQLATEQGTKDPTITARLIGPGQGRIDHYIDMVESNLLRQSLGFAELAQLAITAAADAKVDLGVGEVVIQLYAALPKMKRSYIRSFVFLLETLGAYLQFPKNISRNQGVAVSRHLKSSPEMIPDLRKHLSQCATEIEQAHVFKYFLPNLEKPESGPVTPERQFQLGQTHVTGRQGECIIRAEYDFGSVHTAVLSRAIQAFERILQQG